MSGLFIDNSAYSYRNGASLQNCEGYHPHLSTRFRDWGSAKKPERLPELYSSRADCCGCTACLAVCPAHAITMEPDEEGFEYPVVDAGACLCCKKCEAICPFRQLSLRT